MYQQPTFIEVCAGCGGLSSGFILAGFQPILLNEIDAVCCSTLRANHPEAKIHEGSMYDLDLTSQRGQVDVLMGGVPCQSFSQAGQRRGLDDPRGNLILEFARLVADVQPRVFLIENVKGLLTHNKGETFREIIHSLSIAQYTLQYQILNARNYQVPQKRERVFIIGARLEMRAFNFPKQIEPQVFLRDVLPNCPPSQGVNYNARKREIMEMVPAGGCWIDLPLEVQQEYMGKSLLSGGGKRGMARRLSMDEQCLTLTTSPNQKQTERCHPTETRPLTVREYARIQTFPDDYVFHGSVSQQYKQIGNAVPVNLAYYLALEIKKLF